MATAANQRHELTALGQGFIVHNADKIKINDLPPIYTNPVNQQSTMQIHNQEKNRIQHIDDQQQFAAAATEAEANERSECKFERSEHDRWRSRG